MKNNEIERELINGLNEMKRKYGDQHISILKLSSEHISPVGANIRVALYIYALYMFSQNRMPKSYLSVSKADKKHLKNLAINIMIGNKDLGNYQNNLTKIKKIEYEVNLILKI